MTEKEKLQQKYENKLKELERQEFIKSILPIPAKRIYFATKDQPWISYEAKNLKNAMEIISKFELISMYILKSSTTSIQPKEWYTEKQWNDPTIKEEVNNIIHLELDKMEKYQTKGKFIFYTNINNQVMKICIEMNSIPYEWQINSEVNYNRYGEIITNKHNLQFNNEDYRIKWWSSPGNARFSLFWADMFNFVSAMDRFIKEK